MTTTNEEIHDSTRNVLNILPQYGGVAIVDDVIDDVIGLMNFLSKHSIAFEYFDGKASNFPSEKKKLQIIFIDLKINGSNSPKMMASGLISNIESLIPEDNGPYCIGLWSDNYVSNKDEIDNAIQRLRIPPEFWFDMDKSIITTYRDNDLEILKNLEISFYNKFNTESIIYFLLLLQNIFGQELLSVMGDINSKLLKNIEQDQKLSALIKYTIDNAYNERFVGQIDNETAFKLFIPILNQFIGSRLNKRLLSENIHEKITYKQDVTTANIDKVEYNSELKISPIINLKYPKNVYLVNNSDLNLSAVLGSNFTKNLVSDFKELKIDVSHFCEIVHKKHDYHLFVTALLLKHNGNLNGRKDFTLDLGEIKYNNEEYTFYICCNKIESIHKDDINLDNAIFSISDSTYEKIRMNIASLCAKVGI